jgi:mono/diheme cytochrome c family protein
MSARLLAGTASLASALVLLLGCGGSDKTAKSDTSAAAAPAAGATATPTPAPADTARAPADTAKAAAGGAGGVSPKLVALGDSIFHGQVGGAACTACHGQDAKGTPVGPNLTDNEWLQADGTLEGIAKVITTGVPQPKKAPAPMPPKGGAALTDEQVEAVAAYVYSLSHKG